MKRRLLLVFLVILLLCILGACSLEQEPTAELNITTNSNANVTTPLTSDNNVDLEQAFYSLDEKYQQDINEAYSNYDKSVINDEYTLLWKEKADEYYDSLFSYYSSDEERFNDRYISPEDMIENIQSMKNERRSYFEKQIELYEAHLISKYGSGSVLSVKLSEYRLDMYRAEALEVYQMCLDLYIDVDAP